MELARTLSHSETDAGAELVAVIQAKQNLRSSTEALNEDQVSDQTELAQDGEQANDIQEAGSDEGNLLELKSALENSLASAAHERQLWSIEEPDKEHCCRRAMSLCDRAPWVSAKTYYREKPILLRRAKRRCSKIMSNPNEKSICSYYNGHPANCAFTPNTSEDMVRYDEQLKKCCLVAPTMCDESNWQNSTAVYVAKSECLWFGTKEPAKICEISKWSMCAGPA